MRQTSTQAVEPVLVLSVTPVAALPPPPVALRWLYCAEHSWPPVQQHLQHNKEVSVVIIHCRAQCNYSVGTYKDFHSHKLAIRTSTVTT